MGNVWYEGRLETLPASPTARMLLFQWVAQAGGIAGSARPSPTAVGIGQQKDQDCASSGLHNFFMDEQHLLKVMRGPLCFRVTWHASSYEAYGVSHAQSYPQAPHPSHQLALHQCTKALRVVKWLLRLSLCLWKPSCPCSVHESKVIMTRPGSRGKEKGLANFEICKGGLELSLFSLAVRLLL